MDSFDTSIDPYDILYLNHDATSNEIENNYKRRHLEYHPYRNDPTFQSKISDIDAAYSILSDVEKKRRYDQFCANRNSEENAGPVVAPRVDHRLSEKLNVPTEIKTVKQLRPYQSRIVDSIGIESAIIKMPTGSGKTFCAAELILRNKSSSKCDTNGIKKIAIFLVPTCDLVSQQAKAIYDWTQLTVIEYMGSKKPPSSDFDVIVSTPAAFISLQATCVKVQWVNVSIICFDEVHHVLKNHPYRRIALDLKVEDKDCNIQRIGLSASLTYAVDKISIEKCLSKLCYELSINKMESPTNEELVAGGYDPQNDHVQVDIIQNRTQGVIPPGQRKPHLCYDSFMTRIKNGESTLLATAIWNTVRELESIVKKFLPIFESPILKEKKLVSWEDYAHKLQSVDKTSNEVKDILQRLELWYVALRIVVQSWEEEEHHVLLWLQMNKCFQEEKYFHSKLLQEMNVIQTYQRLSNESISQKLALLRNHLSAEKEKFQDRFRCLVFVQKRLTAYILRHFISEDQVLIRNGINAGFVTSRDTKIAPSVKVQASGVMAQIASFRSGDLNVLVSTSVIEEGFDVPSVNVVISYDHMKDSVELCQRFGRARQVETSLIVMEERSDRPVTKLKEVTQLQTNNVKDFDPNKNQYDELATRKTQVTREQNALTFLNGHVKDNGSSNHLEFLNIYVQKTNATLEELYMKKEKGVGANAGQFKCILKYTSILRSIQGSGIGTTKKSAKNKCAFEIIHKLIGQSGLF